MMELEYRVSELERRMNNMIRICTVEAVQGDRAVVRDGSGLKTGFLPWVTRRAGKDREWWAPEPDEQVVLLCPHGEPALGVILPSIYRDMFAAPASVRTVHRTIYDDGAVIEYDRAAHRLKADIPGTIEATAQNVIVTAAVRVNGPLHVTQGITSDTSWMLWTSPAADQSPPQRQGRRC